MRIFQDAVDEKVALAQLVTDATSEVQQPIRILEAGCGRAGPMKFPINSHITGIDLDASALNHRLHTERDLNEAVVGDIRDDVFPEESFDVVYSSYVLEHVEDSVKAMDNFVRWLKPGGLLMVQIPVVESAWGWIAKHTPHAFHVFYYRQLLGLKLCGTPGFGPYKTYYEPLISISGMEKYAADRNLEKIDMYGQTEGVSGWPLLALRMISLLSLGKLSWKFNNAGFVYRKAGDMKFGDQIEKESLEGERRSFASPRPAPGVPSPVS